ncbi:chemotaxis protein CheA [Herbaspirillum seropedicae]|uniref:chemotaxis protein CheA n=1 Tax=Herbaspirillum seropedicae TaxID=964 RepID=UPI0031D1CAB5
MTLLRDQFILETRDLLQGISEKLMQLEDAPEHVELLESLFRMVHTLKGNSGLFDVPEMTRVLHACEDLMDAVRRRQVAYSEVLADRLLDAMDFVAMLCDGLEMEAEQADPHAQEAVQIASSLRQLIGEHAGVESAVGDLARIGDAQDRGAAIVAAPAAGQALPLRAIPEPLRRQAFAQAQAGGELHWIAYRPSRECFFQGDDPFHRAREVPGFIWGRIDAPAGWPPLAELNAYDCVLHFQIVAAASQAELMEYFRYVPDQVELTQLAAQWLAPAPESAERASAGAHAEPAQDPIDAVMAEIFAIQRQILQSEANMGWQDGRTQAVASTLMNCCRSIGNLELIGELEIARQQSLQLRSCDPLLAWLNANPLPLQRGPVVPAASVESAEAEAVAVEVRQESLPQPEALSRQEPPQVQLQPPAPPLRENLPEESARAGRRAEESLSGNKSVKVEQVKIDRLMNLIGEMVVSKNALPYLAQRAEDQFGVRELAREIKAQYAVINRIAEEMQDAIMQVRMMPVSVVFQRFPRLVRDISRKLGKEVQLVLVGEETEADKNIIEALADPLIHIVRNSLDHGLEGPEQRRASGKPALGSLTISAAHEGDQVVIVIEDDGKGIDPALIKRKAYEKGLIDEAQLERISDQDAVNLVFSSGFSTAEVVSDLSGRGVGMDVVRNAVEKVNGSLALHSVSGKGTRLQISLPLSMAVTKVMIIESDGQLFGVPMEHVMETVRVPRSSLHFANSSAKMVLRGHILGLKGINQILGIAAEQKTNADGEVAVLVVRVGGQSVGLVIDDFRETVDVIQKPLLGILGGLSLYSGSALMGDGSVLMVLNTREMF